MVNENCAVVLDCVVSCSGRSMDGDAVYLERAASTNSSATSNRWHCSQTSAMMSAAVRQAHTRHAQW
jgi:hypothetical protein